MKKIKYLFKMQLMNTVLIIICIALFAILVFSDILKLNETVDLTGLNSVLAGFLFTALSIMISALSNEKIAFLARNNYLNKYYFSVHFALLVSSCALAVNFLTLYIIIEKDYLISKLIISMTLIAIVFLIQSVRYVVKLLKFMKNSE